MKTQISRDSHRTHQRYSGVYQQQGRMITDADWNELVDVLKARLSQAITGLSGDGIPRLGGAVRIVEDGNGNPVPVLRWGRLHVDGQVAELAPAEGADPNVFDYGQQADFPAPPPLPTDTPYVLYADLWERPVTSLEDPGLRDSALYGADTCTRSQTMAQVKWCDPGIEPETDSDRNPPMGTARLQLELRSVHVGTDPCDPCATEVNLDENVGVYLFRVEVHAVETDPDSNPTQVTLKWSSENGAEHYAAEATPPDFNQGDWVYEWHDGDSERLLGIHLASGFVPLRGQLSEGFSQPAEAPREWVRRWDGYCILGRENTAAPWGLVAGRDKGVALAESLDAASHGRVSVDNETLNINLNALALHLGDNVLSFSNSTFVAGDYWLTAVRDADHQPGDRVLGGEAGGEAPVGIPHHYLKLGAVDASGAFLPLSDTERRRRGFPPLTDLTARDVGFNDPCDKLFQGAENVQAALEALCIQQRSSACALTVGVGGYYADLAEAFADPAGGQDLNLCLLPGEHQVTPSLAIGDRRNIRLSGTGRLASVVQLADRLSLEANSIAFENLGMQIQSVTAGIELRGDEVSARDCAFAGTAEINPLQWVRTFEGESIADIEVQATAVDAEGNVLVTGLFREAVDFGDGLRSSIGGSADIFIVKLDPEGALIWVRTIGGTGGDHGRAIAVDRDGNVLIAGDFGGAVDFGDGVRTSAGNQDIFVLKLDSSGQTLWSRSFGSGPLSDNGRSVAVDEDGNVLVTGMFQGSIDFGDGPRNSAGGQDIFVIKLSPAGQYVWSQTYGGTSFDMGDTVAVDEDGNVLVAGMFAGTSGGTIDFGGEPLTGRIFVLKLNPAGQHLWSRSFGSTSFDQANGVAVDSEGNVLVTGAFSDSVDFGGGPLRVNGIGIYVLKLDSQGQHVWSRAYTKQGGADYGLAVAADSQGNALITGRYVLRTMDFGGGPLQGTTVHDVFVLKLDPQGRHLWSRSFGGPDLDEGRSIAVDSVGDVVVAGAFRETVDFGSGPVPGTSSENSFIVKLAGLNTPAPLVTVRCRDGAEKTGLHWIGNRMAPPPLPQAGSQFASESQVVLALGDPRIGGVLRENTFQGTVHLIYDQPINLDAERGVDTVPTLATSNHLQLQGNEIFRLTSRHNPAQETLAAYEVLSIADNVFTNPGSTLIAQSSTLQGNYFRTPEDTGVAAVIVGHAGVLMGNQAEGEMVIVGDLERREQAANILVEFAV